MANIQVHEKAFKLFISKEEIAKQVNRIAAEIDQNYENEIPLFIAILNGSFIFASDLIRSVNITAEISFVKVSSYEGTAVGNMNKLIGLNTDIKDRSIIIIEDIVDTGNTLNKIMHYLKEQQPKSIEIASLLSKPDADKYTKIKERQG